MPDATIGGGVGGVGSSSSIAATSSGSNVTTSGGLTIYSHITPFPAMGSSTTLNAKSPFVNAGENAP